MNLFTPKDFKIFAIPGFRERMDAIRSSIRPKLESIGRGLAPHLSTAVDVPLYVHVAKHARRTVNPPDDTWAALGCDRRGYKKDVHFRIAISRNCVRLLFEAGPEYYAKADWSRAWRREHAAIIRGLTRQKGVGWFADEHDEEATSDIADMTDGKKLVEELTRRRDGQFVMGRRIDAGDFVKLDVREFERLAVNTFTALAPLFSLHDKRR